MLFFFLFAGLAFDELAELGVLAELVVGVGPMARLVVVGMLAELVVEVGPMVELVRVGVLAELEGIFGIR